MKIKMDDESRSNICSTSSMATSNGMSRSEDWNVPLEEFHGNDTLIGMLILLLLSNPLLLSKQRNQKCYESKIIS
jgi:hypothetical protein